MDEPPAARLVHASPGRLRLRLPALRGDAARLSALALAAAALPGVVVAEASAMTGSLLLLHGTAPETLVAALEEAGLLVVHAEGAGSGSDSWPVAPGMLLPAAGAATAAGLALVQLLRKEALPPALTLGVYAARLARAALRARAGAGG